MSAGVRLVREHNMVRVYVMLEELRLGYDLEDFAGRAPRFCGEATVHIDTVKRALALRERSPKRKTG